MDSIHFPSLNESFALDVKRIDLLPNKYSIQHIRLLDNLGEEDHQDDKVQQQSHRCLPRAKW